MTRPPASARWVPQIGRRGGPAYIAIADALEADIQSGRLSPGDPLPTQRELARRLDLNFTTVTRAYAEAQRRALLTATGGRGPFVSGPGGRAPTDGPRAFSDHDLSVNAPPVPAWLPGVFSETLASLARDSAVAQNFLTYDARLGDASAR